MNEIVPALLPVSIVDFKRKITELPEEINFIHLDVLEEDIWEDQLLQEQKFEVHLMVAEPEKIVGRWIKRGAKRIIIHKISGNINDWKKQVEIGLGAELGTPLENIFSAASEIDFFHLMSIAEIGEQGHPLDERIFDRIKKVKERFPNKIISVDGGISISNYKTLFEAGADRLVVGSHFKEIWNSLTVK